MTEDLTEFPTKRLRLQPCSICGRQFNAESLKKHQAICRKVTTKKRKIFDAGKQRAQNSDVPYKATKKTMQIYTGEVRAQDDKSKTKSRVNWRERHAQLIQAIREARSVTYAMKTGAPLPEFRPSEIPSDYVECPYCRRNFNEHAAKRHMPFCQTQHERKQVQPSRPPQQLDRGRTLPAQNTSLYKQPSSGSGPHDIYNNGYKHSNSAPMLARRNPSELKLPPPPPPPRSLPPPPPPRKSGGGFWGSFKRLFGLSSDDNPVNDDNEYTSRDDDYSESPGVRNGHQRVLIRTGRTKENTNLNVRARQKSNDSAPHKRRGPPPPPPPSQSYSQPRNQYGNGQYNSAKQTAVRRSTATGNRCSECGSAFASPSARFCGQCGTRR